MGLLCCFDGGNSAQRKEEERAASAEALANAAQAAQRRQEEFEKSAPGRAARAQQQQQAAAKQAASSNKGEPVLKCLYRFNMFRGLPIPFAPRTNTPDLQKTVAVINRHSLCHLFFILNVKKILTVVSSCFGASLNNSIRAIHFSVQQTLF
ncbi:unnamed protein product [Malus baccata var. baccata]